MDPQMLCFVVLLSSLLILGEGEVGDLLLGHSNQSGNGSVNLAFPLRKSYNPATKYWLREECFLNCHILEFRRYISQEITFIYTREDGSASRVYRYGTSWTNISYLLSCKSMYHAPTVFSTKSVKIWSKNRLMNGKILQVRVSEAYCLLGCFIFNHFSGPMSKMPSLYQCELNSIHSEKSKAVHSGIQCKTNASTSRWHSGW